jgi:tRNA(Ile)-lysidine synthase
MTLLDRWTIERALTQSGDGPLLVALSGGGDSSAALLLLAEMLGAERLRACIVDHALRLESAHEARQAAGFAEALGVKAVIVTLNWGEPRKRAQQEARQERYKALARAAHEASASVIVLGHTKDDQAETVFIRAAAGSGWRGLAGMASFTPAPLWPEGRGLFIARPLLEARRESLREKLRERGAQWIEDPSNANTAYARVRARERLQAMTACGLDPMRLAALAASLSERVALLDRRAGALIESAAHFEEGLVRVDRSLWREDGETRVRALAVLLEAVSGEDRESAPQGLREIEAAMLEPAFAGTTLSGARLRPTPRALVLERDKGAVLGRADGKPALAVLALKANSETVWDGRLALTATEPGWSVEAGAKAEPVLVKDDRRLPLMDAENLAWRWLIKEHVNHRLSARFGSAGRF